MNIILIRHSKTVLNKDVSSLVWTLSEEGIKLAQDLSQNELIKSINILYSSFQTKALETAVISAKPNFISIKANQNLTESTSITNKFFSPYKETVEKYFAGEIDRINDGETVVEAQTRFNNTIEQIVDSEPNARNIGIVSHSAILSIFSSQFIDKKPAEIESIMQMPDIAVLDWESKKFKVFFENTSVLSEL